MANSLNTITVDGVTQTMESYQASQTQANKDNSTLGKDAFLQLLVTQMKYQDPLDPQDNGEYLAQLAQFSALEQMTNVADGLGEVSKLVGNIDTSVLVGQLSNMIGKDVQWSVESTSTDADGKSTTTTTKMEGKVTGVSISDGSPTVIDRVRASQLGEQAALALISGLSDIVFGYSKGHVVTINLHDAVTNKKKLDPEYTHLAKVLF